MTARWLVGLLLSAIGAGGLQLKVIVDGGAKHVQFSAADDAAAVARAFGARFALPAAGCTALAAQIATVQRAASPHDATLAPIFAAALASYRLGEC